MNPYGFNIGYNMANYMPYMGMGNIRGMRSTAGFGRLANMGRMAGATNGMGRMGLFGRLGNSIRAINWSNLLNNTSRTLGVINQAIPIVKQTGPMINNMRSMLKVASLFKDETDGKKKSYNNNSSYTNSNDNSYIDNNNKLNNDNSKNNYIEIENEKKEDTINNSTLPNFFV